MQLARFERDLGIDLCFLDQGRSGLPRGGALPLRDGITGRRVIEYAARNPIHQTLELGGKSAQIVCRSADIDQAVEGTAISTIFCKGEARFAGSRVFVHETVRDEYEPRRVCRDRWM